MTDEKSPKPPIATGGQLAGIAPQGIDEAFRLSQALSRAGNMVPDHFQGKPDEIMAAVLRGAEIGLMPMQALSNIAVINGRASLWGDALPALIQRYGHHIDVEIIEGEDEDGTYAEATLTRGDTGKVVKRQFGVLDAKKAGLWGKKGPWQTYPKRMLAHRARAWAVRDGAADALMGLQVAEEMQDVEMKDVTPAEPPAAAPNLAAQLEAQAEPEASQEAAEDVSGPIEVEVVFEPDVDSAAYQAGHAAYSNDEPEDQLNWSDDEPNWLAGWNDAEAEAAG